MKTTNKFFVLSLLAAIQFTDVVDFVLMMPLGPHLIKSLGITPIKFGFIISAYSFAAAISGAVSGYFVDKFDRKYTLLFIYLGFIFSNLICGFAQSFSMLIVGRILAGSFGGVLGSNNFAIVGDIFPDAQRGKAVGFLLSMFSIASFLGVPAGLAVANRYTWSAPFLMIAGVATIIWTLCFIFVPNVNKHLGLDRKNPFQEYMLAIKEKTHLYSFATSFFITIASFSVIPYIATYLVFNVGISKTDLSTVYFMGGAFTMFSAWTIGALSDKFSRIKLFISLSLISMIPIYRLTNHGTATIYEVLFTTVPLMMFLSGRVIPLMAIITKGSNPRRRGAFMSLFTSTRHLSTAIASFLGGLIIVELENSKVGNYHIVGYLSICCITISIFVASKLNQRVNAMEDVDIDNDNDSEKTFSNLELGDA